MTKELKCNTINKYGKNKNGCNKKWILNNGKALKKANGKEKLM